MKHKSYQKILTLVHLSPANCAAGPWEGILINPSCVQVQIQWALYTINRHKFWNNTLKFWLVASQIRWNGTGYHLTTSGALILHTCVGVSNLFSFLFLALLLLYDVTNKTSFDNIQVSFVLSFVLIVWMLRHLFQPPFKDSMVSIVVI